MSADSYTTSFTVERTPDEVFAAINDVRSWWTGDIEGRTYRLGDVFTYRYENVHRSTQEITESIPGVKVVWSVVDADLTFVRDGSEWRGTHIVFEISELNGRTELRFTHEGLAPDFECFEACSNAWDFYIRSSLRAFITAGSAEVVAV